MEVVNTILQHNFELTLFSAELMENLHYQEVILLRRKTALNSEDIGLLRTLIHCYYELRKLDVPNVYQSLSEQEVYDIAPVKMASFLSKGSKKAKSSQSSITPLVLQKIREEERYVERQLQQGYTPEMFEKALQLKIIRKSFQTNKKSGTIAVKGSLKDNINYLQSKETLIQYLLIGWILVLGMISVVVLTQMVLYPITTAGASPYLLIIIGPCVLLILLYRYYTNTNGGRS